MTRTRPTPPPTTRELRARTLPRRGLGLQEAAIYVGLSPRLFSRLVRMGRAPQPRVIATPKAQVERWDVRQLDEFMDGLPSRGEAKTPGMKPPPRAVSF
jgi:hypothetical protein